MKLHFCPLAKYRFFIHDHFVSRRGKKKKSCVPLQTEHSEVGTHLFTQKYRFVTVFVHKPPHNFYATNKQFLLEGCSNLLLLHGLLFYFPCCIVASTEALDISCKVCKIKLLLLRDLLLAHNGQETPRFRDEFNAQ